MNILALDISLHTGFAYGGAKIEHSGVVHFTDYVDLAALGEVYYKWLTEFFKEYPVDALHIEAPLHYMKGNRYLLHGLHWEANSAAYFRDIPRHEHSPASIKKFITGKGNAQKSVVIRAIKTMGYTPMDDNEADAIALWHYVKDGT